MHLSEGNADDGDVEDDTVEDVGEPYPDAAYDEPQHIHEHAQAARLRLLPLHFWAERPDGQYTQLHALQAEGNADDGYHQNQSGNEILQGNVQPAKYNPDDVS